MSGGLPGPVAPGVPPAAPGGKGSPMSPGCRGVMLPARLPGVRGVAVEADEPCPEKAVVGPEV